MDYLYLINEDNSTIQEPSCLDSKIHKYVPFKPKNDRDGRVDLCDNRGLARFCLDAFYSKTAFDIFILRYYGELERQTIGIRGKK